MKKTAIALSVVFLSTLFFTSCSNMENLSVEKRHYGKGYYVHANGKRDVKAETKVEETAAVIEKQSAAAVTQEMFVAKNEVATKPVTQTPTASAKQSAVNAKSAPAPTAVPEQIATVEKNASADNHKTVQPSREKSKHERTMDDTSTILIAILCIFIPPLAVFLSEGSITVNFWIDLLLCLLFFLPGIIFAFIVCFA